MNAGGQPMSGRARNEDEQLALLRGSLTALTDSLGGIRMERPAEKLIAAGRSRVRRARVLRAAVAAGAAVVTAVVVVWVSGAARPAARDGGIRAHTAAYVISQVRSALSSSAMVIQTTYTFSAGLPRITEWSDDGHFNDTQSGYIPPAEMPESPWAQGYVSFGQGTAEINGKLTFAQVDYVHHEWYPTTRQVLQPSACAAGLDNLEFSGTLSWPAYLRKALSCGVFHYRGNAPVGGRKTIKLTASAWGPSYFTGGPRPDRARTRIDATLYVDPSTYVPVRVDWSNYGQSADSKPIHGTVREDIRLLPPTPVNVAKVNVSIPAGFTKVKDSSFGGPVFALFN
jgi:hypothetical protein